MVFMGAVPIIKKGKRPEVIPNTFLTMPTWLDPACAASLGTRLLIQITFFQSSTQQTLLKYDPHNPTRNLWQHSTQFLRDIQRQR
jgi:hypothetical protein